MTTTEAIRRAVLADELRQSKRRNEDLEKQVFELALLGKNLVHQKEDVERQNQDLEAKCAD
eukprot:CAMPEP_0172911912 /NCGR_PEP_ID=MMETSP1075-20121228/187484_1 /TAXON_ID=2916 /ORGANISM="Ceratium fusus, Strain PA161109" /LENGTH=60 /DNA_ID=CAMNT_0013770303 /DNA_START=67 /DNA_END=246 /DNA_ORIENTATION=-